MVALNVVAAAGIGLGVYGARLLFKKKYKKGKPKEIEVISKCLETPFQNQREAAQSNVNTAENEKEHVENRIRKRRQEFEKGLKEDEEELKVKTENLEIAKEAQRKLSDLHDAINAVVVAQDAGTGPAKQKSGAKSKAKGSS